MKKFFLSLAIMLSAVTMNVNAMRDSWAYDYVRPDLSDMLKALHDAWIDDYSIDSDFTQEVWSLTNEFFQERGGSRNGILILYQHGITSYYSESLESACQILQVLQTIKMEEEAETEAEAETFD